MNQNSEQIFFIGQMQNYLQSINTVRSQSKEREKQVLWTRNKSFEKLFDRNYLFRCVLRY